MIPLTVLEPLLEQPLLGEPELESNLQPSNDLIDQISQTIERISQTIIHVSHVIEQVSQTIEHVEQILESIH